MAPERNLADPDYEPSDEDLVGLAQRAFAHVREQHEREARELQERIATLREAAMRDLAARRARRLGR